MRAQQRCRTMSITLSLIWLFSLFSAVTNLWAGQVTLGWNHTTQNEDGSRLTNLSHYTLHYGTVSRGREDEPVDFQYQFTTNVSKGQSSITLTNLNPGLYYFAITALDFSGQESKYAKEISLLIPSSNSSGGSSKNGGSGSSTSGGGNSSTSSGGNSSTSGGGSSSTSGGGSSSRSSGSSGSGVTVFVDNRDGQTRRTGTWKVSSGPAPWKGESLYSTGTNATFRWTPQLTTAGTYTVDVWWTYHQNRATSVPYKIRHKNGTTTVKVNQRQAQLGGKWNRLGTFTFAAGSNGYVEVAGSNGQASADAVRFGPGTATSSSSTSGSSSSSSTSGSSSSSTSGRSSSSSSKAAEVILDNNDSQTRRTGTWKVSSGRNPWGKDSLYSTGTNATFRWTPKLPTTGTYTVYAWWTYAKNRATSVPYKIRHKNGTTTVKVNQLQAGLGGQWNRLGTFTFAAGSNGYVEVAGSNGQASADAVWFGRD